MKKSDSRVSPFRRCIWRLRRAVDYQRRSETLQTDQSRADLGGGPSGGEFSSPSDLHDQLSKLADEKGGKYYVITRCA